MPKKTKLTTIILLLISRREVKFLRGKRVAECFTQVGLFGLL